MTSSNIYPFATAPAVSQSSSTIYPRRRGRSRALSLLSVDSVNTKKSNASLELPKAEPTTFASNSFKNHIACGSFVPSPPATAVLRMFLPPTVTHVRGRSRYASSRVENSPRFSSSSSSSPVPFITRALSVSSDSRSPSPVRVYSTFSKVRRGPMTRTRPEAYPHDIHPILASLERRSKFCVKKGTCSTCKRIGSGFPQCVKCGASWCSRECRLNGGKKHICSIRPT